MKRYITISGSSPAAPIGIPAPTLSAISVSTSEIDLTASYAGPPALSTFSFYFALATGGPYFLLATQAGPTYKHTGLLSATTYYYRVNIQTAESPSRNSMFSQIKFATTSSAGHIVKWHPGHYGRSNTYAYKANLNLATRQAEAVVCIAAGSNVLGWEFNYGMDLLYPNDGIDRGFGVGFDFSAILTDIANLGGKRIIPCIFPQIFSGNMPAWIVSNPIYGPSQNPGSYGYWDNVPLTLPNLALWRPLVMAAYIKLFQALGAYFNSHPLVEGIRDGNDTGSMNLASGSDFTVAGYRTQYQNLETAAVAAMPNTSFGTAMSFMQSGGIQDCANFLEDGYQRRMDFGGPDSLGYSFMHLNPTYYQFQAVYGGFGGTSPGTDYRGKMGCTHDVQGPELDGSGLTGSPYTPLDIYNWIEGVIGANRICWQYLSGSGTGNWSTVLAMINLNPVTHTAYPTSYP